MSKEVVNLNDHDLIALLKSGNHRYFSVLTDRYQPYILKKCISYVKDRDAAEDLAQEILIKVFTELDHFRSEAKFSTWLFAIIHHTCVDYLRRNKKSVRKVLTVKLADSLGEWLDDNEELDEVKTIELMDALLEQLSPEDKLILLLKYKEKHSIQDIVLAMHLSESAVKMRLKRAREKMNHLYKESKKKR